jgi:hypothetical protein
MNMRLIGARTIKELVPDMVDASNIHAHTLNVPGDRLYESNCESTISLFSAWVDAMLRLDESIQGARLKEIKAKL